MAHTKCKLFQNDSIVIPAMQNDSPCTAVFNLTSNTWFKIDHDAREAFLKGFLDTWKDRLFYFGGYKRISDKDRDFGIWEFKGTYWKKLSHKMPDVVRNATQMAIVKEQFCQG